MTVIEELIRDFQSSEEKRRRDDIFDKLYSRYIYLVLYAANKFKSKLSEDDIKDVAQETFIFIARNLTNFKWTAEKAFSTWIYYIAHRKSLEAIRKKTGNEAENQLSNEEIEIHEINKTDAKMLEILDLWKDVFPDDYAINYLFHIEKQSDKTIAKKLNIKEDAARKRRVRACEKFQKYLKIQFNIDTIDDILN